MKTKTIKVQKHKLIPDGFEDKKIYITSDGKEFEDKEKAKQHEKILDFDSYFKEKYKHSVIKELDSDYQLLYLDNDDFLNRSNTTERENLRKDLKVYFGNYIGSRIDIEYLKKGWNLIQFDDIGDYTSVRIYQPETLMSIYKEEIKWNQTYINELLKLKGMINKS